MADPLNGIEPSERKPDLLARIEHLQHWWREPLAGFVAVGVACFDQWLYGRDNGFTSSLDEILVLTGIALIAGVKNLFAGGQKPETSEISEIDRR